MRDSYREQLDDILADLVQMCQAVSAAVRSSTTALLEAEIHLAEQVITQDLKLDEMQADIEARAFSLLARQAPVAGELRTLVATLRMVTELERMGDLAAHVAKIARLRYPDIAVPEALRLNFVRMGDVAEKMVVTAGQTLNNRNIESAQELRARDEEMDELRKSQFRVMLSDDWAYGVEAAVDVALLGRYYERIADHAASMGRRIIYVVTGEFPEADIWPQPLCLPARARSAPQDSVFLPARKARLLPARPDRAGAANDLQLPALARSAPQDGLPPSLADEKLCSRSSRPSRRCANDARRVCLRRSARSDSYFLPWFLTASIEACAASGSR